MAYVHYNAGSILDNRAIMIVLFAFGLLVSFWDVLYVLDVLCTVGDCPYFLYTCKAILVEQF